uniref:AAA_8 domain-containing protein n=1 Tax=Macrostomum lignano TaxID=282301 RepID=A0A1I8GZ79_9PLAT
RTLAEVSRIARTLLSPHNFGHIAVVAEGNPGISALLARLAAHLAGFKVIQSTPASLTSEGNNKNEKLMFLLRDHEILEDSLFVYLSEFIIHGNINHLFSPEEQTKIVNSVRTDVAQAGLTYNREVAWEFFLRGVRRNFRICLIVTDAEQPFHRLCQQFPVLISTINFIWLQHWHPNQL